MKKNKPAQLMCVYAEMYPEGHPCKSRCLQRFESGFCNCTSKDDGCEIDCSYVEQLNDAAEADNTLLELREAQKQQSEKIIKWLECINSNLPGDVDFSDVIEAIDATQDRSLQNRRSGL